MRIYDLLSLQTGFTPKRCGELHLSHSIFPPFDIITNLVKWLLCSSSTRTPLFCFLMSFLFAAGNVSLSIAGHGSSDWCGNSTKDVCDEMDNDPTTLLKHTPSSSQKFIPQGNQNFFLSFFFFLLFCVAFVVAADPRQLFCFFYPRECVPRLTDQTRPLN